MSATRFASSLLPSPIAGVSAESWKRYYSAFEIQPVDAISASGGYGSFDLRPRRLVELNYARNLGTKVTDNGRHIQTCEVILPWTERRCLGNFLAPYAAFARSNLMYYQALSSGQLEKPAEMSMSGALAILHRGGRGALKNHENLFSDTRALYEKARDIF